MSNGFYERLHIIEDPENRVPKRVLDLINENFAVLDMSLDGQLSDSNISGLTGDVFGNNAIDQGKLVLDGFGDGSDGDVEVVVGNCNSYATVDLALATEIASQADWEAQTLTHIDTTVSPGDIKLAKGGDDISDVTTLTADFDGTNSDTEAYDAQLILQRTLDGTPFSTVTAKTGSASCTSGYEYGTKYTVGASNIQVDALRIWPYKAATFTLRLWRCSDQALLASASVAAGTSGWTTVALSSPVILAAGQSYIVSFTSSSTQYNYKSSPTFSSGVTWDGTYQSATGGSYPNTLNSATYFRGMVDIVRDTIYKTSGNYTHGELDLAADGTVDIATLSFNKTTPINTTLTLDYRVYNGSSWGDWVTNVSSGVTLITKGTNVTGYKVQWRANLATTDNTVSPALSDVTVSITFEYHPSGNVVTIPYGNPFGIGVLATLSQTTPANTSVTLEYAESDDNVSYSSWVVTTSGSRAGRKPYVKFRITLSTTDVDATPTAASLTIDAVGRNVIEDTTSVIFQFNNFTLASGITLTSSKRMRGVFIFVRGNCTINGTIDLSGKSAFADPGSTQQRTLQIPIGATLLEVPAGGLGGAGGAGGAGGDTYGGAGGAGSTPSIRPWYGGTPGGPGGGGGGGGHSYAGGTGGNAGSCVFTSPASNAIAYGGSTEDTDPPSGQGYGYAGDVGGNWHGGGGGAGGASDTTYNGSPGGNSKSSAGAGGGKSYTSTPVGGSTSGGVNLNGGGMLALIVKGNLTIGSSGVVNCDGLNGQAGGNGANAGSSSYGAGGGGGGQGGGGGGVIVLVYRGEYTNDGSVTVNGGTGGAGGTAGTVGGSPAAVNGTAGGNGSVGTIVEVAV